MSGSVGVSGETKARSYCLHCRAKLALDEKGDDFACVHC